MLGVDRDELAGRGGGEDQVPPAISDSLFASATVRPARRADSVGPRPMEPAMPLRTTSAGRAASSSAARGPARISGREYSPFDQPFFDAAA